MTRLVEYMLKIVLMTHLKNILVAFRLGPSIDTFASVFVLSRIDAIIDKHETQGKLINLIG